MTTDKREMGRGCSCSQRGGWREVDAEVEEEGAGLRDEDVDDAQLREDGLEARSKTWTMTGTRPAPSASMIESNRRRLKPMDDLPSMAAEPRRRRIKEREEGWRWERGNPSDRGR